MKEPHGKTYVTTRRGHAFILDAETDELVMFFADKIRDTHGRQNGQPVAAA